MFVHDILFRHLQFFLIGPFYKLPVPVPAELRSLVFEDPSNKEAFVPPRNVLWGMGNSKAASWIRFETNDLNQVSGMVFGFGTERASTVSFLKKGYINLNVCPDSLLKFARLFVSLRVVRKKWPEKCKRRHGGEDQGRHASVFLPANPWTRQN